LISTIGTSEEAAVAEAAAATFAPAALGIGARWRARDALYVSTHSMKCAEVTSCINSALVRFGNNSRTLAMCTCARNDVQAKRNFKPTKQQDINTKIASQNNDKALTTALNSAELQSLSAFNTHTHTPISDKWRFNGSRLRAINSACNGHASFSSLCQPHTVNIHSTNLFHPPYKLITFVETTIEFVSAHFSARMCCFSNSSRNDINSIQS
jgi:hypothetical protein